MDILLNDDYLNFNTDTIYEVRKSYDLDDPERMEPTIQILEEWIQKQSHFTNKDFERRYLERVLITTKGLVERAKMQIDRLCSLRTTMSRFFEDFNIEEDFKLVLDIFWLVFFPKLTQDHERVAVFKIKQVSNLNPQLAVLFGRYCNIVFEYAKSQDYFKGLIIIIDYRGVNIVECISKVNISDIKDYITLLTEGYGVRMTGLHLISDSKLFDVVITLAKQMIHPKIMSRLKVHAKVDTLADYIDRSILPLEYGGTEKSIEHLQDQWNKALSDEKHVAYVKKADRARTNETYRTEDKHINESLGIPGSFRKLTVD